MASRRRRSLSVGSMDQLRPTDSTTRVLVRALRDRDVGVRAEAVELLGVQGQSPDGKRRRRLHVSLEWH